MRARVALVAAATFALLAGWAGRGALRYAAAAPAALDARSLWLIATDAVPSAAFVVALVWLAVRAGEGLLFRLGAPVAGALRPVYGLALGLGLAGTALFWLGWAGWFGPAAFGLLGVVLGAAGRGSSRGNALAGEPRPQSVVVAILGGVLLFVAWHFLVTALAPATEWDSLAYHLALPKMYLRAGRIVMVPWLPHAHWPHLTELLYAVPLALGLEPAAALLHASFAAAWVLAIFAVARLELGEGEAWVVAALASAQPVVLRFGGTPHSDAALALYSFLTTAALWRWRAEGRRSWLLLAGACAGLAAACKLHGLALAAIWTAWLLAFGPAAPRGGRLRRAALFAAPIALIAGPWLLRTWVAAGNPIWPFLFGGRDGAEIVAAAARRSFYWGSGDLMRSLTRYRPAQLVVPCAALALLGRGALPLPPFVRFAWIPVLPYFLCVAPRAEAWRFLWPCYPALALYAAAAGVSLWRFGGAGRWAAAAALLAGFVGLLGAENNNQLFPVLALRSRKEPEASPRQLYLERTLDYFKGYQALAALPPRGRLLLFGEVRGYHLDADYMWGDPVNQGVIDYRGLSDGEALRRRLAELGVGRVLVNGWAHGRDSAYDARALRVMGELLARSRPLLREGSVRVYELPAK